jgi:hypothetical protein
LGSETTCAASQCKNGKLNIAVPHMKSLILWM